MRATNNWGSGGGGAPPWIFLNFRFTVVHLWRLPLLLKQTIICIHVNVWNAPASSYSGIQWRKSIQRHVTRRITQLLPPSLTPCSPSRVRVLVVDLLLQVQCSTVCTRTAHILCTQSIEVIRDPPDVLFAESAIGYAACMRTATVRYKYAVSRIS